MTSLQEGAPCAPERADALSLVPVSCCLCEAENAEPIAVGEDFEYRTSPDTFLAMRCRECGLVYLNPRPSLEDHARIYPPEYHAFNFSAKRHGFVYQVRQRLEARRLLAWCRDLGDHARILDVGCGDGFHLRLLRQFGKPGWTLEGADVDSRAVATATAAGIRVHHGSVEQLDLPRDSYDLVLLIMTIEHVADPPGVLGAVRDLLRPGGLVGIVTDNAGTLDAWWFRGRHWGGYHFPRHWNLFTRRTLAALVEKAGFEVVQLSTGVSPVNWVYSIRNYLVDAGAPRWLSNRFSLEAPVALAAFTAVDTLMQMVGYGGNLRALLRRPLAPLATASAERGEP